jgi:DsbC/DsbD-like thiol-disulfide interchange protein
MQGTGNREQGIVFAALLLSLLPAAFAQDLQLGARRPVGKEHVALLSDTVDVTPGKEQLVELRFRVDPGFHINSHTPKDELLIPTVLKLDAANGVKVLDEQYPAGTPFRLDIGAGDTLDVYQGEFRVVVRMVLPKGATDLVGSLRYQACDHAACFPPRTLPVKVAVMAK